MKKGIINIFFGNFVFMVFGVLNNFILPKYLSIDAYALLKSYMLYISYAGFLGLGYTEGMFLEYGGKTVEQVKSIGFGDKFRTFLVMQIIVGSGILVVGIAKGDGVIMLCALGVLTTNIINYFKNFTTAVAEYKMYSVITSFEKIAIFVLNVFLLFVFRTDNYVYYVCVLIFVCLLEIVYVMWKIARKSERIYKGKVCFAQLKNCVGMGFVLLLGNGISTLFTGIDQWFIKILMTNKAFAIYSFAVSMERIVALFITPITTVLYNYFCRKDEKKDFVFLQQALVLWGFVILLVTFPLKWIVQVYITNYAEAIDIIAILFCGQALNCIINGIYVNVYKAKQQQGFFLKQMLTMTVISIALNIILWIVFKNMICIAIATLITKMIWLIVCEIQCVEYRYSLKANVSICLYIISFIGSAAISNPFVGFMTYVLAVVVISLVLMKETVLKGMKEIKDILRRTNC